MTTKRLIRKGCGKKFGKFYNWCGRFQFCKIKDKLCPTCQELLKQIDWFEKLIDEAPIHWATKK